MTSETDFDYAKLTQDALRGVVRTVLSKVAERGTLPGNHHFFISFLTQAEGVAVSKRLREQYPDEMTIALQHQFWDLQVHEDRFEVRLKFSGVPEKLVVPFDAIRVFVDPSAQFAIPFDVSGLKSDEQPRPKPPLALPRAKHETGVKRAAPTLMTVNSDGKGVAVEVTPESPADESALEASGAARPARPPLRSVDGTGKAPGSADVVDLDTFRKK